MKNELEFKTLLFEKESDITADKNDSIRYYNFLFSIGVLLGLIMMFYGFKLWYNRLQ